MSSNKLKVLLVSDMSEVGGTEIATYISAKELQPRVDYISVIGKKGPLSTKIADLGIEHFEGESHSINPFKSLNYVRKIRKIINEKNINVIHAQMARPVPLIWLAKSLSKNRGLKIVWTSRGLKSTTYPRILPIFNKLNIKCLGNCKQEQQKLIRFGVNSENTGYVYNAYRLNPQTAVRTKLNRDFITIGTLSALRDDRRVDLFIDIAKLLLKDNPFSKSINFLIGGDGPAKVKLEQLARSYGIQDYITFVGNVEDVEHFMQQLNVYVSPIIVRKDSGAGLSNSIVEAMITKTPVCAYSAAAIGEIVINDYSGWLVEPGNTSDMVDAITKCINNPEIARSYVENAYQLIIDQCDPKNYADKLIKYYQEL